MLKVALVHHTVHTTTGRSGFPVEYRRGRRSSRRAVGEWLADLLWSVVRSLVVPIGMLELATASFLDREVTPWQRGLLRSVSTVTWSEGKGSGKQVRYHDIGFQAIATALLDGSRRSLLDPCCQKQPWSTQWHGNT